MSENFSVAQTRNNRGLVDHRAGQYSRAEQETIIRYDRTEGTASLWTADVGQARRWVTKGYGVQALSGGWACAVPKRALSFRRLLPKAGRA